MVGDTSHRLLPVEICETTFACGAVGGFGKVSCCFVQLIYPLPIVKKWWSFPEAMFDPKIRKTVQSLIHKWNQKRNDSLIYFEASHPNGENRTWRVLNAEAMGFHCHLTLHVGWFSNKTEFITSTFPVSMPRGMGWKHWKTDDKIHGLPAWTRGARPWAHGKMVFPELLRHLHGVTWSVASLTLLFADGDDGNAVVWYFDHAFEI